MSVKEGYWNEIGDRGWAGIPRRAPQGPWRNDVWQRCQHGIPIYIFIRKDIGIDYIIFLNKAWWQRIWAIIAISLLEFSNSRSRLTCVDINVCVCIFREIHGMAGKTYTEFVASVYFKSVFLAATPNKNIHVSCRFKRLLNLSLINF